MRPSEPAHSLRPNFSEELILGDESCREGIAITVRYRKSEIDILGNVVRHVNILDKQGYLYFDVGPDDYNRDVQTFLPAYDLDE